MERFLQNLLTASVHGSVVILAVLVLRLVLRKTPKKYICLLWLLAGVRLLLPIEIRSELSLQPQFTLPVLPAGKWTAAIPWIWGAIACGFGVYSLISYLKLKNRVREAVRIRGGWECDKIDTAFILGFVKPKIYIPMGMSNQSKRHILAHERTHLDKGDHWIKMIGFLALALHWFNPLVWVAYILLCRDIEMACDQRVVQFMDVEERKSYSSALLSCSSGHAHFAASPVAFGEVGVKQRILSVLNYKRPGFWICLLGVLAFFFVTFCLMTTPPAQTAALTPEQQAERTQLEHYRGDIDAALGKESFYYEFYGTDSRGSVRWSGRIARLGGDTLWVLNANNGEENTDGRMERNGKHYAWYDRGWVETGNADTRFTDWENLFLWDPATAELTGEEQLEQGSRVSLNTHWEGSDGTVYLSPVTLDYDADGTLTGVWVEKPNYPDTDRLYLARFFWEDQTAADAFREAEALIQSGNVSQEELDSREELDNWGVSFRVDRSVLTSLGADIAFSQEDRGQGNLSTTDQYWLEKYENGSWQPLPTIARPSWEDKSYSVGKGFATSEHLDWTPLYGTLEQGSYRVGKTFQNYNPEENRLKSATFYAEFDVFESVDGASPEAKAAVERCYSKLEELKQRTAVHWHSVGAKDWETEEWVCGDDYLRLDHYFGPESPQEVWDEHDKSLFPRVDTAARYQGVGYETVRENPKVHTSTDLGLGVSSLNPYHTGWTYNESIAGDFLMSFFERSNMNITFPEGIGVVSDQLVRFAKSWQRDEYSETEIMTYRFNENGDLVYMESSTDYGDGHVVVFTMEIYDDTPEEIQAKIAAAVESPVYRSFSWQEAQEKYLGGDFNTRQDGFINTAPSPITGPVDAARLALGEYPKLGSNYLSTTVFRDETAGMWKVTIDAHVDYQSTYEYRDVYLSDSGITKLLVYEGPVPFDEERK